MATKKVTAGREPVAKKGKVRPTLVEMARLPKKELAESMRALTQDIEEADSRARPRKPRKIAVFQRDLASLKKRVASLSAEASKPRKKK